MTYFLYLAIVSEERISYTLSTEHIVRWTAYKTCLSVLKIMALSDYIMLTSEMVSGSPHLHNFSVCVLVWGRLGRRLNIVVVQISYQTHNECYEALGTRLYVMCHVTCCWYTIEGRVVLKQCYGLTHFYQSFRKFTLHRMIPYMNNQWTMSPWKQQAHANSPRCTRHISANARKQFDLQVALLTPSS